MNKNKALLAGAAMVALSMPLAQKDAKAASALMNASAEVVAALVIAAAANLDFGSMSLASTGSVVMTPNSASRTDAGGATVINDGSQAAGRFTASGATGVNIVFSANLPQNLTNGTDTLTFDSVVLGAGGATPILAASATLIGTATDVAQFTAGSGNIPVGATLTYTGGAAASAGTYTGSFTLTANYQ